MRNILISAMTAGALSAGAATQPPVATERVRVTVDVVHVHDDDNVIAPELRHLERELRFPKNSGARWLDGFGARLATGGAVEGEVSPGHVLRVELVEHGERLARVQLRLTGTRRDLIDTALTVPLDKTFLTGGLPHEGGRLVFCISVLRDEARRHAHATRSTIHAPQEAVL